MENNITDKKNFIDYIVIAIEVVCIILVLISSMDDRLNNILIIGLGIFFIAIGIVSPVNDYWKKGQLGSRRAILLISARIVLTATSIISGYIALSPNNYNLKYTYWIAFISILLQIFILFLDDIIKGHRKRKAENKKYNLLYTLGGTFFILALIGFQSYSTMQSYIQPKHQIALANLKAPDKILIYKFGKDEENYGIQGFSRVCEISSLEDIDKITNELRTMEVVNVTLTDLINYKKKMDMKHTYYRMRFEYSGTTYGLTKLEDGYISEILITSKRITAIEEMNSRSNPFLVSKYYREIYPVNFSKDTMDMMLKWIGN